MAHTHSLPPWKTREVKIGKVGVGGSNPVRIQSMTTSDTRAVDSTVEQIIQLADAGCEIARVTVQGLAEAKACESIKNTLLQKGYEIPLVADIHFYPPAALHVVDFVDKVRINPGNFADRRATFKILTYDDKTYAGEIKKIEEKFTPLVEKCRKLKKALRIGVNHGSLSDRIMNRYGDTPYGMIESAFEFARICRGLDFHDFLFSMKASNPLIMIEAYRMLAHEQQKLGWDYPLHLGVTEAGEGEDGRIKSALGIGTLLLEGIGDTIRISLTEDPWHEIEPCRRLIQLTARREKVAFGQGKKVSPFLHRDGSVLLTVTDSDLESPTIFEDLGCTIQFGRYQKTVNTVDGVIYRGDNPANPILEELKKTRIDVLFNPFVLDTLEKWDSIFKIQPECILLNLSYVQKIQEFYRRYDKNSCTIPVILNPSFSCSQEDFIIQAASECGRLLIDKRASGIALEGPFSLSFLRSYSFNLLQASRMRTSKTEFISCPGCGRTLFNLQEVSRKIREKTAHLPGVKIAIMGCIVNGPGEMADADFGYVGSKPGKIDLYVGKVKVEQDIDFEKAEESLISLIKSHGRWIEKDELSIANLST